MLRESLPFFFAELQKIAQELSIPAQGANSAVVPSGPPASPFTRRKGFRRLENQYAKEAAVSHELLKHVGKVTGNIRSVSKKLKRTASKLDSKARDAVISGYVRLPDKVKKTYESVITHPNSDPSDHSFGVAAVNAAHHISNFFKGGSVKP